MKHRRGYKSRLDETRSLYLGYDFEQDSYMIIGKTGDQEGRLCLSQDAMWSLMKIYPLLLRYQAQCAPDGVGAEL